MMPPLSTGLTMYSILMIDDDFALGELLEKNLSTEQLQLTQALDVTLGMKLLTENRYDAMILDVMLPDIDGFSALKRLRQQGYDLPILMLSARGDTIDRIVGIEMGADDYLPKPFDLQELIVRLKALLRRRPTAESLQIDHIYQDGNLLLNRPLRQIYWQSSLVHLSSTEFSLLLLLVDARGQVVSKAHISEQVLGRPLARYERSIDVHVSNLRSKLGILADGRSCIQTIFRQGYQYIWEA